MLKQRGDTMVEVILAFAVFSMVSVGTMTVMGQGTNAAQRALEITLVRQQIDAQAEALRAAQQAYSSSEIASDSEWRKIAIADAGQNSATYSSQTTCPSALAQIPRSFIMDPRNASLVTSGSWFQDINARTTRPYAQVETSGAVQAYGIWIEREFRPGNNDADVYDFKVRACWQGAGMNVPLQIETVVRLYEPGS